MTDILVFGGTGEGRLLAEVLKKKEINTLVSVATTYGESLLREGGTLRVHTGVLDEEEIKELIGAEQPKIVLDATHPYAVVVSEYVKSACEEKGFKYVRIGRENDVNGTYSRFDSLADMIEWLNEQDGVIFSTLGAKEARDLTAIKNFEDRLWVRILPLESSLKSCTEAGIPMKHIICMQGPFSEELNVAMLKSTGADILISKETGATGGFPQKIAAAKKLAVAAAVIKQPEQGANVVITKAIELATSCENAEDFVQKLDSLMEK